jgi:putative DNA modification/repair radical SAM protein
MTIQDKIRILAEGAKYDVSCSSSGSDREAKKGFSGNSAMPGICHSWSDDGRCISLLKILMTNKCIFDCAYCVNRSSNDIDRASFTPDELSDLVMNFYRRNYIEGLFVSSGVERSPDYTMEQMILMVKRLRTVEKYNGYIHMKGIPGADLRLVEEAGLYVDRLSVNLEVPTSNNLMLLAPQKNQESILAPMAYVKDRLLEQSEVKGFKKGKGLFVPAGQTTQMMVGATNDTDLTMMRVAEGLYQGYKMKRVYYSAYVPLGQSSSLLPTNVKSPLLREHRLYQADWLLRFYGFSANELLDKTHPNFDVELDPKCFWALMNYHYFPVEINKVSLELLLRVPGIGVVTARRIISSRKFEVLTFESLKKLGVVLKRAKYFILCNGHYYGEGLTEPDRIRNQLVLSDPKAKSINPDQISLFDSRELILKS